MLQHSYLFIRSTQGALEKHPGLFSSTITVKEASRPRSWRSTSAYTDQLACIPMGSWGESDCSEQLRRGTSALPFTDPRAEVYSSQCKIIFQRWVICLLLIALWILVNHEYKSFNLLSPGDEMVLSRYFSKYVCSKLLIWYCPSNFYLNYVLFWHQIPYLKSWNIKDTMIIV